MKTVLHVGKFYPPVPGGMERVVSTLCETSRGIVNSRVLVAHTGRRTVEEWVNGVHVTRVATIGAAGSVPIAPAFASYLSRERADLIILHEPNPWALLSLNFTRLRAPLAIWYHSDVVRPPLQYRLFYAPIAARAYAAARQFIVSSPPLAQNARALRRAQPRVRVIPFGINPAEWPAAVGADDGFVLFAGRHVPYKGVDVLLRALTGTGIRAVIAGDGPMRDGWRQQASALGLAEQVEFPGDVSDEELRRLMARCAVFVLPSVTRAEAFGYVQLEAMASGKPVISTDVPSGVSWVNEHERTGLIVPARDVEALRNAMTALMRDAARRAALGAAARARVEGTFTTEHMRERLCALYAEHGLVARPQPC